MSNGFLSAIIALLLFLIFYPAIRRKRRQQISMIEVRELVVIQSALVLAANTLLLSRRVSMSFNDDDSLYASLAELKSRLLGKRGHHVYAYYNFPLAFLMCGLLDLFSATRDGDTLKRVEKKCGELLDDSGELQFTIDKLDQATFGFVFLKMYELTRKLCYLEGARHIHQKIQRFRNVDGLYRYRSDINVFFIDTVGLLCPFLVAYARVTGDSSAIADARAQVQFALNRCVTPGGGLAIHAYSFEHQQPLGSVNWARGMGWLLLGLSSVARYTHDPVLMDAMRRYQDLLFKMRERNGYWPQFLGHTNDRHIDSSATLMFLHAFQRAGIMVINAEEVKALAGLCVDRTGRVVQASGDTIYINKYSRVKGPSELSQGLMLSILAGISR